MADAEFIPTTNDMESEHCGLLVAPLDGGNTEGHLIAIGPDLTQNRAFAAFISYTRVVNGHDDTVELHESLVRGELTITITPTRFTRDADGGWTAHPHSAGSRPAAWLVPRYLPAHTL